MIRNIILISDALRALRRMPDDSVHCVVTSPPYYGLRDYGVEGQLGLESTPEQYIANIVAIFREVRRVLRPDGTCWLNLGDSYASSWASGRRNIIGQGSRTNRFDSRNGELGFKEKDLMLIPHRVAIALQDDGWWVRSDIVWAKTNPMPESVTDRPTKAHEYIFLLTKEARYWYDADAIREPLADSTVGRKPVDFGGAKGRNYSPHKDDPNYRSGNEQWGRTFDYRESCVNGRNKRTVWQMPTRPYPEAHFATFPVTLPSICIQAGCPETTCAKCGTGYDRQYHGWQPTCDCTSSDTLPGIVLDPFGGAGTTAIAAIDHHRDYVLIELSCQYAGLAQQRIQAHRRERDNANPLLPSVLPNGATQLSLFTEASA